MAEPDDHTIGVLNHIKEEGFKICLLSNNNAVSYTHLRAHETAAYAYWKAGKPGIKTLEKAMKDMGSNRASTVMVGDQIFTDMWCGHNAGLLCVMTAPICNRDQFVTKIKRPLEKLIMSFYFRRKRKHVR